MCAQVLTSLEEFAAVRDSVLAQGLAVDHDSSGPVYLPLSSIEVRALGQAGALLLHDGMGCFFWGVTVDACCGFLHPLPP
jgi:hypothetical protein